ncbi:uncharacterized protein BDV17DRAFT_291887 [Aspergillus undulatus]|uniref:uncharacterized protein n=1 Tax=Aspergillus undulatus TaxID=1810928 RepID=UPI003CCD1F78
MAFFPGFSGGKITLKSSIPLPFNINIGLVIDDFLDPSILQNKWAQLIGRSPLLGGVLRSNRTDPRKVRCGSTVDFEGRTLNAELRSFLSFSWRGGGGDEPRVLHDDLDDIDSKFLFNAVSGPEATPIEPAADVVGKRRLGELKFFGKVLLVHLPGAWVDEVRAKAQKELESNTCASSVQLTRNDIIAALYLKMLCALRRPSDEPVDFFGPINYRGLLEPPERGTYYPHNSIVFLRLCPIRAPSADKLDHASCLATNEYKHLAAIRRELRVIEDRVVTPAVIEPLGSIQRSIPLLSPWTTFDYGGLDFSGANANANNRQGRKASVVFVNPDVSLIGGTLPSLLMVGGKDFLGDTGFGGRIRRVDGRISINAWS